MGGGVLGGVRYENERAAPWGNGMAARERFCPIRRKLLLLRRVGEVGNL